ncbi:MAG: GNAT family N-acetyltransferase [Myxococcota bacterium]|nr:GNAT family N-acetyltransferase [Myxococcota bacterium]
MFSVIRRIVQRRSVYLVELKPDACIRVPTACEALEIRPVEWSNVNRVSDVRSSQLAHGFRQQLTAGWLGVYAFHHNALVGHFWAQPSGPTRRRIWGGVDFGPNEVVLAWGWVSPDHRGKGIFQSMIAELTKRVRQRYPGQRIIADVPIDPRASLTAHRRIGFTCFGRLTYVTAARRLVHRRYESMNDAEHDQPNVDME